jgi:hypothetical protein
MALAFGVGGKESIVGTLQRKGDQLLRFANQQQLILSAE